MAQDACTLLFASRALVRAGTVFKHRRPHTAGIAVLEAPGFADATEAHTAGIADPKAAGFTFEEVQAVGIANLKAAGFIIEDVQAAGIADLKAAGLHQCQ